jgi:hypothetical protein
MNRKKYVTALLIGAISVVPAATATPAMAAPGGERAAVTQAAPADDYRIGYRQGYGDGWQTARDECTMPPGGGPDSFSDKDLEWVQGYNDGFEVGFQAGFGEYCYGTGEGVNS